MPFDSSGTFNRVRSWVSDANAKIKIRADYHDNHDSDLASGLSNCITKDGKTQPIANIPMNQKRLTNLGEPDQPGDAATKNYVDTFKTYATGVTVTGANYPNGMVNFSATTGITGLSWANADMSWVGKTAEAGKWRQRIAAINNADGTGAELVSIDKGGVIGLSQGQIAHNLSYDGTTWRTNLTGTGTLMTVAGGGFSLQSNDTSSTVVNAPVTLTDFFSVNQSGVTHNSDTSSVLSLSKKIATGGYVSCIYGMVGTQARWRMDLGNGTAETGTGYIGSGFTLYAWDNTGANPKQMMTIDRAAGNATFAGWVISEVGVFASSTAYTIIAASGGSLYFRPGGTNVSAAQTIVASDGSLNVSGHIIVTTNTSHGIYAGLGRMGRNGMYGGYSGNWHNWLYSSGYIYGLVDNTNVGAIQMVSDYRTKKNVKALPSMWDKVKALKPIVYQYKAASGIAGDQDDDEPRWGFVAHELQGVLTKSAASFEKDAVDKLQSPNVMVLIAALTKALQEAQARIEALEARPA